MKGEQIMYEIFSELLHKYGVTPYKVSKETGVSQSTLSDWKRGISTPKLDKMQKIADYFGVSVEYLMSGVEQEELRKPKLTSKDERDIAKTVEGLMERLESNDGAPLYFNGVEMTPESKILFEQQLKSLVTTVKEINKVKYKPNKNKK